MNSRLMPFFDTFKYFAERYISDFGTFNFECSEFSREVLFAKSIPEKLPKMIQLGFSLYSPISSTKYCGSFSCSLSRASEETITSLSRNTFIDETALLDVKLRKKDELIDRLFYSLHSGELLFNR